MITLSKLAKLANVSVSTASKAFSGSLEVNEETRAWIFSVAKEHGVFKNFYNVKYPRLVIAVAVPEFQSSRYGPLLSELHQALDNRGCSMAVMASGFLPNENNKIYDYYSKYTDVDGIIIIGKHTLCGDELEIPSVIISNSGNYEGKIPNVSINSENALKEAVKYAKAAGVQKIGFISETKTKRKLQCFVEAMNEIYGKHDEKYIVVTESRFEESGYDGMRQLIESGNVPRIIICGYDNIAIGAMRCLNDFGLKVPNDVAIIGIDDNAESKYMVPSLSSINVKHRECASAAVDMVISKIFSRPSKKNVVIEAELKLRESSVLTD